MAKMFGKPENDKKGNKEEEGGYDASKRNPLFAGAETPCTWEIRDVGPQLSPVRPYDTEHSNSCRKADLDADAFSEDDADGDEIGAYAQKSAEGIMEDNNHDGEDPDMADWNDVEPNMPEFAAPEEDSDEENDVGIYAEDEGIDSAGHEDGFDCFVIGADDDDEVLQEEQELKTKRKIQTDKGQEDEVTTKK
ncbi:hypothetical protein DVH05_015752 [Phytophthora capsici]|nr:hypothetical protein DVH05_015752 [Phytophthora capsici]